MRKVVIMSGVSGSGKSTYIVNNFPKRTYPMWNGGDNNGVVVVSADHYFMDPLVGKKYTFDASKLSDAHGACFRHFITELSRNYDQVSLVGHDYTVVVDNTNTTAEEIAPYVLAAQAYRYEAEIITLRCGVDIAHARNVHDVPVRSIGQQLNNLQLRRLPPWWKNTTLYWDVPTRTWVDN